MFGPGVSTSPSATRPIPSSRADRDHVTSRFPILTRPYATPPPTTRWFPTARTGAGPAPTDAQGRAARTPRASRIAPVNRSSSRRTRTVRSSRAAAPETAVQPASQQVCSAACAVARTQHRHQHGPARFEELRGEGQVDGGGLGIEHVAEQPLQVRVVAAPRQPVAGARSVRRRARAGRSRRRRGRRRAEGQSSQSPSPTRYAAPTSLTTQNACDERITSAARPTAARVACT